MSALECVQKHWPNPELSSVCTLLLSTPFTLMPESSYECSGFVRAAFLEG